MMNFWRKFDVTRNKKKWLAKPFSSRVSHLAGLCRLARGGNVVLFFSKSVVGVGTTVSDTIMADKRVSSSQQHCVCLCVYVCVCVCACVCVRPANVNWPSPGRDVTVRWPSFCAAGEMEKRRNSPPPSQSQENGTISLSPPSSSDCFTGLYRVLPNLNEFQWVLLRFTSFYFVLLGFTGFYRVLLGFTEFYWVFTEFWKWWLGFS